MDFLSDFPPNFSTEFKIMKFNTGYSIVKKLKKNVEVSDSQYQ